MWILLFSVLLHYSVFSQVEPNFSEIDSIIINDGLGKYKFPGFAIAVVHKGDLVYSKGFGWANKEKEIAFTTETVCQIGSFTKMFIGNLVSHYLVQNKLTLLDTLSKYFPSIVKFPVDSNTKPILLIDALIHKSGLPRYPPNLIREDDDPILEYTKEELYAGINRTELEYKIGTKWSYSNYGYGIIGTYLENRFGKSLESQLYENIFKPLEMNSTSLFSDERIEKMAALPYRDDNPDIPTQPWNMGALAAAGNIYSNIADLSRFLIYQLSEKDSSLLLQHNSFHKFSEKNGYGLGCFTGFNEIKKSRVFYHGGDLDGYASNCVFYTELEFGFVILGNGGSGRDFGSLSDLIRNRLFSIFEK